MLVTLRPTSRAAFSIAWQTCRRCSRSVPEPMCMCRPVTPRPLCVGAAQAIGEVGVPDAVLRLLAAGVGLLAVAVAEAGIDAQRDVPARGTLAELVDHVGRAAIDVNALLDNQVERFAIEDVGRVDDRRRRMWVSCRGGIAGGQGAADFAGADRIDQHALRGAPDRESPDSSRLFGRSG